MKGLFKLTMAAAALVGLASCSTDDLQMESKKAPAAGNGILVEVEDLIDANSALTRSAFAPDGKTGTLKWNTGDVIKVTDGTLVKYDLYEFDGSAFVFDKVNTGRDAAWITEPEYACYDPTTNDPTMEWDNAAKQAIGYYYISAFPSWDEDAENEGAFNSEIPLWGTAEADATYGVKVNMKYLTGVLKINMENVPGNADEIRITGWKNLAGTDPAPMTGDFKAILANDDEIDENAVLVTDENGIQGNTIRIDCSWATKGSSVFFVPLIAQKYGLLTIEYKDHNTSTYKKIKTVEGLNVERKKYYNLTKSDFDFAGDYPSDITALLAEKKGESEISLKMANATQVISGDQTITIPETSADITLNFNTIANVSEGILKFEAAGDYAGTLTIKAQNAGSSITNMYFNLPNAKIVIDEGDFSSVDLGADATSVSPITTYNEPSTLVAKALSIGAKGKVKNIYANAELGYGNDGVDFVMVKGSQVAKFELEKNYKADQIEIAGQLGAGAADIDMTAWQDKDDKNITISTVKIGDGANINDLTTYSDVEVSGGQVAKIISDGNVTIGGVDNTTTLAKENGQVTEIQRITNITAASKAVTKNVIVKEEGTLGTLTPNGFNRYNLTVNGKAGVTATATALTLTIDGTTAYVNNANIDGAVTITDTEEADAVQGTLTVNAGQTLTLNGGYINTISVNPVTIAGKAQWLTIKHGAAAAFTAINSITGTGKWKVDTTTKSIWNGKKIGATPATASLAATYGNPTVIFTACQLATSNAAADLYSNIDLNNQAWTRPTLAGNFYGRDMDNSVSGNQFPTIENLKLVAAANSTNGNINGVGLFGLSTADAIIANITVKNVTSEITEANNKNVTAVGTLLGNAGANKVTIQNVTVNTANIGATVADNIGGLVGMTTGGAIEIDGVNVTGLTLNGQYRIGGVVGKTTGSITAKTNSSSINVAAINVPASFNAEPDIKVVAEDTKDYGTVGMIAGEADAAVTVTGVKLTVNNLIKGNRQKYGYKMRWFNAGPNVRYYFGERGDDHTNQNVWIGRLTTDDAALTAGTYIVTNATEKTAFEEDWNNPTHCYSVKHDMYDALDSEY